MATKADLRTWIIEILTASGRPMTVVEVAREVWQRHEHELRASGDLFFTWQYDLRWAAQQLRDQRALEPMNGSRNAGWQLADRT